MRYHQRRPRAPLDRFVRLIWSLEIGDPAVFGPPERIVPDGIVEIVFHLETPFGMRFAGGPVDRQPAAFALSQTRRFVEISPAGSGAFVAIRFEPWGACHFFESPLTALADCAVPTADLWGKPAVELHDRLGSARTFEARAGIVEQFLLGQLARHGKADVEPLARAIWGRSRALRVATLAADLGMTERTLQRVFRRAFTTTPKHFARLTRFLHACRLLRAPNPLPLASLSQVCGYYDQAHLSGEFRELAGMTPTEFQRDTRVAALEIG